jgi:hypothetical protein
MVEINTHGRGDVGLTFRRNIEKNDGDKRLYLPRRAIPAGKLSDDNQVIEEARGANHLYKQVDTPTLQDARDSKYGLKIKGLEEQLDMCLEDEFNFAFLEYTDAHRITKVEAYQMAGILGEASDFRTTPIQTKLYRAINPENGLSDPDYRDLYVGIELFLRGCIDHDSEKPIMGGIPPLELEYVEDLMNLYEQYDVESFYIDFDWNLPTGRDAIPRLRFLMRRIANQRLHENVLFYGMNMRYGTQTDELGYIPAADYAACYMGIDILGGNHKGKRLPPDVIEEIEIDNGDDEGVDEFRIYDRTLPGYREPLVTELGPHWPENTGLNVDDVVTDSVGSKNARGRYQSIINAEQMELDLQDLRKAIEENRVQEYNEEQNVPDELVNPGRSVFRAFDEGFQSTIGEWT